jgi:hypothetical protein
MNMNFLNRGLSRPKIRSRLIVHNLEVDNNLTPNAMLYNMYIILYNLIFLFYIL